MCVFSLILHSRGWYTWLGSKFYISWCGSWVFGPVATSGTSLTSSRFLQSVSKLFDLLTTWDLMQTVWTDTTPLMTHPWLKTSRSGKDYSTASTDSRAVWSAITSTIRHRQSGSMKRVVSSPDGAAPPCRQCGSTWCDTHGGHTYGFRRTFSSSSDASLSAFYVGEITLQVLLWWGIRKYPPFVTVSRTSVISLPYMYTSRCSVNTCTLSITRSEGIAPSPRGLRGLPYIEHIQTCELFGVYLIFTTSTWVGSSIFIPI